MPSHLPHGEQVKVKKSTLGINLEIFIGCLILAIIVFAVGVAGHIMYKPAEVEGDIIKEGNDLLGMDKTQASWMIGVGSVAILIFGGLIYRNLKIRNAL